MIDPEMEALKDVTYTRSDWIKVVLVIVAGVFFGAQQGSD